MRKVLRRERWRPKMIPVIRPGRVTERKARIVEERRSSEVEQSKELAKNTALPRRKMVQERKMSRNLPVRRPLRRPLSGRMRQGPTFNDLAIPRPAEMKEVKKVIMNKVSWTPK